MCVYRYFDVSVFANSLQYLAVGVARRPAVLRDRERAVLELARDNLLRLRRERFTDELRHLAADDLVLRGPQDERDLERLAFLAADRRRVVL